MVRISLVPVLTPLYLYVSTFRSMCAVPNMAVFCSSLTSWFPGMLLTYFLNDFKIIIIIIIIIIISHFSPSVGKHSPILGYVINRNRLDGLIYNLKSFLQLNMNMVVIGPVGLTTTNSTANHHAPTVKPEAATAAIELLMTGVKTPETRWAVHKRQVINLGNCCSQLVDLLELYDDARTCKL